MRALNIGRVRRLTGVVVVVIAASMATASEAQGAITTIASAPYREGRSVLYQTYLQDLADDGGSPYGLGSGCQMASDSAFVVVTSATLAAEDFSCRVGSGARIVVVYTDATAWRKLGQDLDLAAVDRRLLAMVRGFLPLSYRWTKVAVDGDWRRSPLFWHPPFTLTYPPGGDMPRTIRLAAFANVVVVGTLSDGVHRIRTIVNTSPGQPDLAARQTVRLIVG